MGGSKTPATTTQVQKVELPAWVDQASQQNYQMAQNVSSTPYEAYTGQRVAELNPLETQAGATLQTGMDQTNAGLGVAQGAATAATGFNPAMVTAPGAVGDVTAQSFLSRDINAYMDPNLQSVINPTMDSMRRQIALGTQGISDSARSAGAWGGSRQAVGEAVYGAEGARNMAATEAGLRSSAFTDAAGRITADNASALTAALANQQKDITGNAQKIGVDQGNQNAGIAGANVRLQGGNLATQAAQTASDTAGRNSILQQQFGASARAVDQAKLDTRYQDWQDQKNYPAEQLNMRLAALGMSPYGKTSTTTGTSQSESSSNPLMTGVGAAATILPLLFSDRKVKKNVKKLGKVPGTTLNKYEFEYKPGFMGRTGPKQIGLMAQDVEKKVPGAVQTVKVGGKPVKAVDYSKALADAPRDPRDDKNKPRRPYKPRIGVGSRVRAA